MDAIEEKYWKLCKQEKSKEIKLIKYIYKDINLYKFK